MEKEKEKEKKVKGERKLKRKKDTLGSSDDDEDFEVDQKKPPPKKRRLQWYSEKRAPLPSHLNGPKKKKEVVAPDKREADDLDLLLAIQRSLVSQSYNPDT